MKNSFRNKVVAIIVAVLLVSMTSPAAYAARATARIKLSKASIKVAVGGKATVFVDYTELEELEDDNIDIFRARVYNDKDSVAKVDFAYEGSDITAIEIEGIADGETMAVVKVGRFYSSLMVTVGRGNKSPEQIKKEEAAKKAEEDILKNDKSELGAALAEAIKKTEKKEVMITTNSRKDPAIPVSTLKALAARARQAGKHAIVRIDSPGPDGKVQSRLYVDPAGLSSLKSDFKTGITVDRSRSSLGSNYIASVKCDYTGVFLISAEIAVKVSGLPKNPDNVAVYNVDPAGKLRKLPAPSCFVDKDGFLHFFVKAAGEIVLMKETEKAAEEAE